MSVQTIDDITKLIAEAMKAKDEVRLAALRLLKAALLEEKTSGKGGDIVIPVTARKLVSKNLKSIEEYTGYGEKGATKVAQLQAENDVLKAFLPVEMSDEDLHAELKEILASNPEAQGNFGVFMRFAREKLGSRVEGRRLSDAVKALQQ